MGEPGRDTEGPTPADSVTASGRNSADPGVANDGQSRPAQSDHSTDHNQPDIDREPQQSADQAEEAGSVTKVTPDPQPEEQQEDGKASSPVRLSASRTVTNGAARDDRASRQSRPKLFGDGTSGGGELCAAGRGSYGHAAGNVSARGGGGGGGGLSVTVLDLNAHTDIRPSSRQQNVLTPTPRALERDGDMADLKLIRDFQVRRKYGRRPGYTPTSLAASRDKNMINLGLSGTRYFAANGNKASSGSTSSHPTTATTTTTNSPGAGSVTASPSSVPLGAGRPRRLPGHDDPSSRGPPSGVAGSPALSSLLSPAEEDPSLKDLQSPGPSFPPLSPVATRSGGAKSDSSSFYSGRFNGQSPSLLVNHFGFSTIRPDTFSGIQRHRRIRVAASDNDVLLRELEQHAQRQILACQNMGYTHRGSRAAESVLSLKHTVSPSAFHPSSIFTRHAPRADTPGRSGSGGGGDGDLEDGRRRRTTHPAPGGKLSMPRLVVTDRQAQAARRATLPSVNGNSLQVVLAHSHGK